MTGRFLRALPTFLYVLLFLPGTFVHELAHFIAAKLLFVHVGKFSLKPEKREKEIILGSVSILNTDFIRKFLVGTAPVIFGLIIILATVYLVKKWDLTSDFRVVITVGYLMFVIGNSMFSSKADLEGAWKIAFLAIIIFAGLYFLGIRISINVNEELMKTASLYLLPVLAVDAGILAVLSLMRR